MQVDKYTSWIDNYYPTKESCVGRCNEAVSKMVNRFSDLTVQVGFANNIYHCWCLDPKGNIIDPTTKQFEGEIKYTLIANRFLKKHEIEIPTGAIFLDEDRQINKEA